MPVQRILGVVLIVAGAILAWQGWQAKQSFGSRLGEMMGSTPTNAWLMLGGGVVLVVAGVALAVRR